jgi:isopenicillin-N epimerase
LTGLPPLTPTALVRTDVGATLPPCQLDNLKTRLYDEFRIEIPVVHWNGRHFVRISIQGYNTQAEVEQLVAALRFAPQPITRPPCP